MSGPLVPFVLGYLFGKASGTTLFKWPWETAYHGAPPAHHGAPPAHHDAPHAVHAPPDGIIPASTSTAAPWHEARPAGLPPFPGPGWMPAPAGPNAPRAWALMSTLPVGATKYEHGPSGWLAFHASRNAADGKKYVTVWQPKQTGVVPS